MEIIEIYFVRGAESVEALNHFLSHNNNICIHKKKVHIVEGVKLPPSARTVV